MVLTTRRAAAPTAQTQLTIRINAVKRLVKEREGYVEEIAKQRVRVEEYRLRAVNETDANKRKTYDADLRKQKEVLEENVLMVPHMEGNIQKAMVTLEHLVLDMQNNFEDAEALASAKEAVAAAKAAISAEAKPV
ncbi:hypothetical protein GGI24_001830 [Coemansia furcata]|nr:hypothetical protein GGI24_001830 [Coemansia furcata]